ncbi:MAG: phospho-sugar mutase, partial [Acidimicrobiia bacterium]
MSAVTENDLLEATRRWIEGDPDPKTRGALLDIVDAGDRAAIADAMGEPLTFGTAGIRGEVGPGSGRMNRATVIRTTRGLADHLITKRNG